MLGVWRRGYNNIPQTTLLIDDMIDLGGYNDNCQLYVLGIIDWLKNFTSEYFYNYDFKQFKVYNKEEI